MNVENAKKEPYIITVKNLPHLSLLITELHKAQRYIILPAAAMQFIHLRVRRAALIIFDQ